MNELLVISCNNGSVRLGGNRGGVSRKTFGILIGSPVLVIGKSVTHAGHSRGMRVDLVMSASSSYLVVRRTVIITISIRTTLKST
jgi:hypothetical protein